MKKRTTTRAPKLSQDETKAALKEALHEWLDAKFAAFGRWSVRAIGAALLTAAAYIILAANGWHR